MLIFENKGLLDPRAITTFGVSAKGKDNAIGYFGTGLKYAIAILLREGCEIEIATGEKHWRFRTEVGDFRNKEFEFIKIVFEDGSELELPFTTELGKNWELWQAFREIYCNCIDENGRVHMDTEGTFEKYLDTNGEQTRIMVTGLDKIWKSRHEIVLASEPVYYCNKSKIEIHPGRSRFLYYQGIKVYELDSESIHTYNFVSNVELTEDRTIADLWSCRQRIAECLSQCSQQELLEDIFFQGNYEHSMNFDYVHQAPSEAFKMALVGARETKAKDINRTAIQLESKFKPKKPQVFSEIELTQEQQALFDGACIFLSDMGVDIKMFDITFYEALGEEGIMGQADMLNDTIKITKLAFTMGRKQLVSTLLEEYVHLRYRHQDHSRAMQSFLFDSWLSAEEKLQGVSL